MNEHICQTPQGNIHYWTNDIRCHVNTDQPEMVNQLISTFINNINI